MDDGTETPGNTRQRIIGAALALFNEHGYEATTFRLLSERLDITPAAVNYHFRLKDDILGAVVEPYLTELEAFLDSQPTANSPERRHALLGAFIDLILRHRDVVRFLARDVGAANHRGLAGRLDTDHTTLRVRLVGSGATGRGHLRAAAAIGAAVRPITHLDDLDYEITRRELTLAAYGALVSGT